MEKFGEISAALFGLNALPSITISLRRINGIITDENKKILAEVNIAILNQQIGTISDKNGSYSITLPENQSVVLGYSFIGYQMEKIRIPMLKKGQIYTLDIQLKLSSTLLGDIIVTDKKRRQESFSIIKPKHVSVLPSSSGGVEAILKTLPGVSSANELSSYHLRPLLFRHMHSMSSPTT